MLLVMSNPKKNMIIKSNKPAQKYLYLKPEEKERLIAIKLLLEQNLQTNYTLPELAKKAFMNEFKLKKGFKQLFNKSIHVLHYELRMQKVIQLLKETDLKLEDIARKIGYNFLTSFISAFRKSYKITPFTYRKRHRGSER